MEIIISAKYGNFECGLHLLPKVGIITLEYIYCQKWKFLLEPNMATLTLEYIYCPKWKLFPLNTEILSVGYVYCQKWESLFEPKTAILTGVHLLPKVEIIT